MGMLSWAMRKLCVALAKRLPKRVITRDEDDPYLERYYLVGAAPAYPEVYSKPPKAWLTSLPTVYLHRFVRGDEDKELHNHPWQGTSFILAGGYLEERRFASETNQDLAAVSQHVVHKGWEPSEASLATGFTVLRRTYHPGNINRLAPDTFHRVDLLEKDAWTLFIIGPKVQTWGFWDRHTGGFMHWRDHDQKRRILARLLKEQKKNKEWRA